MYYSYSDYNLINKSVALFDLSSSLASSLTSDDEMKVLLQSIEEHRVRVNIAASVEKFPPPLQSIPPKPMFFDIAFEELTFPTIHYNKQNVKSGKNEKDEGKKEDNGKANSGGGGGGWFSGWF